LVVQAPWPKVWRAEGHVVEAVGCEVRVGDHPVPGAHRHDSWKQVLAGNGQTCAIRTDLGDGTTTDRHVPNQGGTQTTWTDVQAGLNMPQALMNA
jgi:hypothetical protein